MGRWLVFFSTGLFLAACSDDSESSQDWWPPSDGATEQDASVDDVITVDDASGKDVAQQDQKTEDVTSPSDAEQEADAPPVVTTVDVSHRHEGSMDCDGIAYQLADEHQSFRAEGADGGHPRYGRKGWIQYGFLSSTP